MHKPAAATYAGLATLAIPALAFAALLLVQAPGADGPAGPDMRCAAADQAVAPRVAALVASPDDGDTRRLSRAVHILTSARSHCEYGWVGRALDDYAALGELLNAP